MCCFRGLREGIRFSTNPSNIDIIARTILNVKNTQIMVIDNNRLDHTDFMIDGERISEVEEFVYLGSKITKECNFRTEVRRRLAMA